ncbi:MAG: MarR family transcriptional regulator [Bacteroidales bacterium]|nr:MarR family transcriptional regulator [Bacteroidales bacterium]
MDINETVDFHLRSTLFAMRRMYNLLATENGITQGIGYALVNIGKEGIPATKIAPLMGMTSSSLSRLLKTMESDGFIYRKPDKEDKRVVRIFLTKEGQSLKQKIENIVLAFNFELFEKISPEELAAFARVTNLIKEQVRFEVDKFMENKNGQR